MAKKRRTTKKTREWEVAGSDFYFDSSDFEDPADIEAPDDEFLLTGIGRWSARRALEARLEELELRKAIADFPDWDDSLDYGALN